MWLQKAVSAIVGISVVTPALLWGMTTHTGDRGCAASGGMCDNGLAAQMSPAKATEGVCNLQCPGEL